MKRIYLIRHGETESNRQGIFRGRLDIPLSQTGLDQARDLKKYFENISIDIVYSSPLQRALKTAEVAFPKNNPQGEELLNNIDLGSWSGQEKKLVKLHSPQEWDKWINTPEQMEFPGGGETLADVFKRAETFLQKIAKTPAQDIAVVSHRSVTKVILAAAVGLRDNYFWKFHLDNASVSILYHTPERGFTIARINDTHHLKETVMEWY